MQANKKATSKQASKWINQNIYGQINLETSGFNKVVPLLKEFSDLSYYVSIVNLQDG